MLLACHWSIHTYTVTRTHLARLCVFLVKFQQPLSNIRSRNTIIFNAEYYIFVINKGSKYMKGPNLAK